MFIQSRKNYKLCPNKRETAKVPPSVELLLLTVIIADVDVKN